MLRTFVALPVALLLAVGCQTVQTAQAVSERPPSDEASQTPSNPSGSSPAMATMPVGVEAEAPAPQVAAIPEPFPTVEAPTLAGEAPDETSRKVKRTAVEEAIHWSRLYAEALQKVSERDAEIARLRSLNAEKVAEIEAVRNQLKQAEKELLDANTLLIEMDGNLDNWRKDVLGFREEMRRADVAQIEALEKVLSLLGAESLEPPPAQEEAEQ